jgi:hypothetical protein
MTTIPPFPTDSISVIAEAVPQLEPQLDKRLAAMALIERRTEQEREKQLQEDAEFKKQLDDKSLKELMQLQRQLREEAEKKASVLKAVRGEDMLAPTAYIKDRNEWEVLTSEDADRIIAALREKHIRTDVAAALNTSFSAVKAGQDPNQQLQETKKWLTETFPDKPTDALVVKDDLHGGYIVVSLGVSDYEIDAARELQSDKRRFEEKSADVTTRIQEKIKEGPQKTASLVPDVTATALATPDVQRDPTAVASTRHA